VYFPHAFGAIEQGEGDFHRFPFSQGFESQIGRPIGFGATENVATFKSCITLIKVMPRRQGEMFLQDPDCSHYPEQKNDGREDEPHDCQQEA
jgi:hypothetical protein